MEAILWVWSGMGLQGVRVVLGGKGEQWGGLTGMFDPGFIIKRVLGQICVGPGLCLGLYFNKGPFGLFMK